MSAEVIRMLVTIIQLYLYVVLARIILSWIPNFNRSHPIGRFIYQVTDPVLEPVRRALPPLGMVDISPIIVFFGLRILQFLLLRLSG